MAVDWQQYSTFWVTLTYHNAWAPRAEGWKRDLDAFERRLRRAWGGRGWAFVTWRLERQRRGAPHYHMIVGFERGRGPSGGVFRAWCAQAWLEITGAWGQDWAAMAHGVHVDHVVEVWRRERVDLGGILGYLVSEHCKVDQNAWDGEPTGRTWGVWGELRDGGMAELELTPEALQELCRRLRAQGQAVHSWYLSNLSDRWPGFYVLGDGHSLLRDLLAGLDYTLVSASGAWLSDALGEPGHAEMGLRGAPDGGNLDLPASASVGLQQ